MGDVGGDDVLFWESGSGAVEDDDDGCSEGVGGVVG